MLINITGTEKNNHQLLIEVKNLSLKKFANQKFISLKVQDSKLFINIQLKEKTVKFIHNNTKELAMDCGNGISIVRKNRLYNLRLKVPMSSLLEHDFKIGNYEVLSVNENVELEGWIKLSNRYVIEIQKKINDKVKRKKYKERKKQRNLEEKKERINKMVESLNFIESLDKDKKKGLEFGNELTSKKIYLKNPISAKRCEKCVSFTGEMCSSHKVNVSENHGCSRFHSFKTLLGGGFSPR